MSRIEAFDEIPPAPQRRGGKGRKASQLLMDLKSLKEKQKITVNIREEFPDAKTFEAAMARVSQKTQKLDYRPAIHQFPDTNTIVIYRNVGSQFAVGKDGQPIVAPAKGKAKPRRMTVAEVAATK